VARYSLVIKASAAKEIKAVARKRDRQRIVSRIRDLAQAPRPPGCEKLSGRELYRIRQGDYRVLYAVNDAERAVTVVRVAHRRDVYRR
jgi:mRNA interferase RelE/StbE